MFRKLAQGDNAVIYLSKPLLSSAEAARLLGVSTSFLEKDRWRGGGIPYVKVGHAVRYTQDSLEAYVSARIRTSTTEDHSMR